MIYSLEITKEAQSDIEKAFKYHQAFSKETVLLFNDELKQVYSHLEINPYYPEKYKSLRAINFKSFPFIVFYNLSDTDKVVTIYALFNTFLNTNKYPI